MATSGSVDYTRTRAQLVERAFRLIGVGVRGEPLSDEDSSNGVEALNAMIKHWATLKVGLWQYEEIVVFLTVGTAKYSLGPTGDNACLESDLVQTKLDGALAASATAVTVNSTTGMVAADIIGIVLTDGSLHWDTIASVDTSTTLTLTTGVLTAASDNAVVYTYTDALVRPLKLTNGRRRIWTAADPIDTPFTWTYSRQEYFDQPNKATQGVPTQGYYDPQLTNGAFHVWPTPASSSETIHATAFMPLEDFDAAGNTPDLPPEWLDAIAFNLADRLIGEYEVPDTLAARVEVRAGRMLGDLMMWDEEDASLFFGPDRY